jgi:hypothetical protein
VIQLQRVAEGDQLCGALGGLDARYLGHTDHIALFEGAASDQVQGGGQHVNFALCYRQARGDRLGPHVHHAGAAVFVQMAQFIWGHARIIASGGRASACLWGFAAAG